MNVSYYLTRPKSETPTCIYARICYSGYKFKYYLEEKIHPLNWNIQTQEAKRTSRFKESPEFNQRLTSIRSDIQNTFLEYKRLNHNETPNPSTFRTLLDRVIKRKEPEKKRSDDFWGIFQEIIETSEKGVRLHNKTGKPLSPGTITIYKTTLKHLKNYAQSRKRTIDFATIDFEFYTDYVEYLTKDLKLSTNTIGKNIQTIKVVLNEATERGINTNRKYQSKRFKSVRENSDNIYLSEDELQEIQLLDLSENKRLEMVRDLFLVGCYTGLRFSDFSILKPDQIKGSFIETTQIKTGAPIVIPIHPVTKKIIEKYDGQLPKAISNQKTNEYLKEIGRMIKGLDSSITISYTKGGTKVIQTYRKWELITTHTARRSFATNQYKAGVPSLTIMAITGHKSEKSFFLYIKFTPDDHAKLMKQHWDRRRPLKRV